MPDTSERLPRATNDEIPIPRFAGLPDDRGADHPGLGEQRHAVRGGRDTLAKVACSRTSGSVLMMPEAVRPDHADAPRAGDAEHLGLEGRALGARLREARREDHHAVHLLAAALLHDPGDRGGRHGDDGEVDVVGDVEDAAAAADRGDVCAFGFTGHTGPAKPARWRFCTTAWPIDVRVPTGADDRDAARRQEAPHRLGGRRAARSSMAASAAGVGCRPRRTSTTPSAKRVAVSNPACVNTPIILRFSGSTDAVKPVSPTSRARAARCSSSTVASPRPWLASSTKKATSASDRWRQRS